MNPEDEWRLDPSYAFTDGWRLGESGTAMTEDHLLPYPPRLKRAFTVGYEGGREWYLDHVDVAPLRVSGV